MGICLAVGCVHAQKADSTKPRLIFTSYIGKGGVNGQLNNMVSNGSLTMTGLELQFKKHSSLFGEVNFDGYTFIKSATNYSLSNTANTIALTVGYKYRFTSTKLSPYLKMGIGFANISYPEVNIKNGITVIENTANLSFQYQSSVGLAYNFNANYGLFVDAGFQQYLTKSFWQNNLSVTSIKIGFISAF